MRYRLLGWLLVVVLCGGAGCTKGPHGARSGVQGDMDSVGQWNVLANHVADRINNELIRQHYLDASIHVRHSCGGPGKCGSHDSFPFDEGFNDLLTTQLVSFGVNTVRAPESATLTVEYKVQAVYQPSDYRNWTWPKPGALIALAAGIVVFENAPWELIAAATAVDMFRTNYQPSGHYEVIITTSILDKNRYVMRTSDIYYVDNADYWLYQMAAPAKEIRLTGSHKPAPPPSSKKTSL